MKIKDLDLGERPFRVGPWVVEPRLNRISRGDTTIQLELRIMDVLVYLASRAGEVVPRHEIVDAVWATEVISDNTLTHTIAEVRNALGDEVKNPTFVETIHRKGYRLIAPVTVEEIRPRERSISAVDRGPSAHVDDPNPYPGLSAFAESDAEFFFGREVEVGQMWRKLTSRKLLAVIGASGVGKSSFLRAGVVPARPKDWAVVVCEPGEAPFASLARALVPEFVDDRAAISKLVHLKESGEAVAMGSRWRNRYAGALLIVDQFEELFTLNPTHIQIQFADLLRRLVDEADAHVVLGVRDDFLHRCHDTGRLAPIFDSLTAITPPVGDALRRALVEPARRLAFSFENDQLVDEMMASVEGERGALPLIAFAVARLWDLRDRESRILTWDAYEQIGGVGGALAGHAEATLKALGNDRIPIVREVFRNLFTAEGSRLARSVDDLLSVFDGHAPLSSTNPTADMIPAREAAADVLSHLCDARLLTCFEEEGDDNQNQSRVEVVHESLLTSWPRLVSWRSQDIEDARYRDEFRQAAQFWVDRNRSPDLLWTGAEFNEYRLWRKRFSGGLCAIEEEFARELVAHAKRRKRRRRTVAASVVVIAMILSVVFWALWRQSLEMVRRAESIELLALGASFLDSDPNRNCSSTALAYSIASLEANDTPDARSLAVRALWSGSVGFAFKNGGRWVSFAANDQRLIAKTLGDDVEVYDRNQGLIGTVQDDFVKNLTSTFAVTSTRDPETVGVWDSARGLYGQWSVSRMRLNRLLNIGAKAFPLTADSNDVFTLEFRDESVIGKSWAGETDRPTVFGAADGSRFSYPRGMPFGFSNGELVGSFNGGDVWMHDLARWGDRPSLFGRHDSDIVWGAFGPDGDLAATADENGIIKIWRVSEPGAEPVWVLRGPRRIRSMSFDNEGDHFAAAGVADRSTWVWDLHGPPTARPWILGGGTDRTVSRVMLSGDGRWLVSSHALGESGFLWPVEIGRPHVLESDTDMVGPAVFLADGRRIVAAVRDGSIRAWPLVSAAGFASSTLFEMPSGHASHMAADPSGRYVLAAGPGGAWLVPTDGGSARRLLPPSLETSGAAFSSDGKLAATSAVEDSGSRKRVLRVWNLETGEERVSDGVEHREGDTCRLEFSPDGTHLYGSIASALFAWDLTERSLRPIEGEGISIAIAPDGREIFTSGNTIHPAPETRVYNPVKATFRVLAGHVDTTSIALDAEGMFVVTGSLDGTIKVSPADGGEPHLLVGHRQAVNVSVSPNGRRIVSIGLDGKMCLWRVPDISKPPLHTLPREELIAKLETFTNLRVARDEDSSTGWKVNVGAFPGWETVPTW